MFLPRCALALLLLALPAAAQLGAKLEPPPGRVLHGIGSTVNSTAAFNLAPAYIAALGPALAPAVDTTFLDLARYFETARPIRTNFLAYLAYVAGTGRVPEVGLNILPDQDVAAGKYDGETHQLAKDLKALGKPVFLRPGIEVVNAWNAYTPLVFPQAWRRIVDIFRVEGADDVAFVWCYAAAGFSTFADFDRNGDGLWYPGDEWVDWMGLNVYDARDFTPTQPPNQSYLNAVALCEFAARRKKPVMIAETTAKGVNISAAGSGDAYWNAWFAPFFAFLQKHDVIRSFKYINWDWSKTSQWPTWGNADITANAALLQRYVQEMNGPRWLHLNAGPLFAGPWPVRGFADRAGKPLDVAFAGAPPMVDALLVLGLDRIVIDPKVPESLRDYGVPLAPLGFLKVMPLVLLYLGKTSPTGTIGWSHPALPGPGAVYFELLAGSRLSAETLVRF